MGGVEHTNAATAISPRHVQTSLSGRHQAALAWCLASCFGERRAAKSRHRESAPKYARIMLAQVGTAASTVACVVVGLGSTSRRALLQHQISPSRASFLSLGPWHSPTFCRCCCCRHCPAPRLVAFKSRPLPHDAIPPPFPSDPFFSIFRGPSFSEPKSMVWETSAHQAPTVLP